MPEQQTNRIIRSNYPVKTERSDAEASLDFKIERAGARWSCKMERREFLFDQPGGRAIAYIRAAGIVHGACPKFLNSILS